mgnify:CR=1 FL=1|jgi:hypothetical protein
MLKKIDNIVYKLSPWRNMFDKAHAQYNYTDCMREMKLIEMYRWNYSETPAFYIRKV